MIVRADRQRFPWWKLISVWAGFLLLHFSYKTFPGTLFRILAEDHEATFFHMKMLFNAYVLVSAIELLARRRAVGSISGFLASRALIAVIYPWIAITIWFSAEALGIHLPIIPWEIVYANVVTALGIAMALGLEQAFGSARFGPVMRVAIAIVFAAAALGYVAFSLNVPVHFFTTP
jgi:hypothetical protein